jgi:two-component system, OmpR family, phosphate regulon sensor histidine kinase PhoR
VLGGRSVSVKHRAAAGFSLLLVLFLALVFLQLVIGGRMRDEHTARADEITRAREANRAVLQFMTDAETGVRGFQLTGERKFLEPYESGRAGAFSALATAGEDRDSEVRRLVSEQRQAASQWLYAYAIPIVNAGQADTDEGRAERGKELFDRIRTANSDVDAAIATERETTAAVDRRAERTAQLLFASLAVLILATGLGLAVLHQRQLLRPIEQLRRTLRRLTAGDLSARAEVTGPAEIRALIGSVNGLAEQTERLIGAEQARSARGELRHAVAAELRSDRDWQDIATRIAEQLAFTFGASQAHTRAVVQRGSTLAVTVPAGADPLDEALVRRVQSGALGAVTVLSEVPGAIAIPLAGDNDCPPGLVCLVRPSAPVWSEGERRLLAAAAREIEHALTQERLRLRQLRLINELRILDEQKDVFVSTVTHELRTPLTSILGYTEMLADDNLSPAQLRNVDVVLRNANRLQATVADLLLLDRSSDRLGPESVPVDVAALAGGLHADLGPAARAKDLDVTLEVEPAWVRGDAAHLERALRNLMENAIKFTPAGGRVGWHIAARAGQVVVTVTDTGIGIPADDVPGLFTPFHRAANAMDRAVQGNGLGLAIVRTIVTEHGGSVAARSELDRGSSFTVTLPAVALG